MKLKLSTLKLLFDNLVALDGYQRAVEIDGKTTLVFDRHSYSAKFTWNRVKNLRILQGKAEDLEALRVAILRKYLAKPTDERIPSAAEPAFQTEYAKALSMVEEVKGLLRFPRTDLNVYDPQDNPTGNKIAATILAELEPFLEGN